MSNFFKAGKAAMTSDKHDWETPQQLFEELNKEHKFTLDAAANDFNAKLDNYFTPEDNALEQEWRGRVFCNPPYGRGVRKCVKKAYEESLKDYNELIVLLIPSRTDTTYWHDFIFGKAEIDFLRGRLKFEVDGEPRNAAPFPSAIVTYGVSDEEVTIDTKEG